MSSFVMIEGFQYFELSDKAKHKVQIWLDEVPMEYEVETDDGPIGTEYDYFSDWEEQDQQDHFFINGYLFNKDGRPIHQYVLTEHRLKEASNV